MTANIVILQLVILGVVLESDLGRRKIGWFRILRPVIAVVLVVPFFFTSLPASGHDLLLQAAGVLAGALLGLIAVSPLLVAVGYDPSWPGGHWARLFHRTHAHGKPAAVSRAGWGYAVLWAAVTALRLGFAWGSQHLFSAQLGHFLVSHQLSGTALTNAFIFLAVGMDLFRSVLLGIRGQHARLAATAPVGAYPAGEFR